MRRAFLRWVASRKFILQGLFIFPMLVLLIAFVSLFLVSVRRFWRADPISWRRLWFLPAYSLAWFVFCFSQGYHPLGALYFPEYMASPGAWVVTMGTLAVSLIPLLRIRSRPADRHGKRTVRQYGLLVCGLYLAGAVVFHPKVREVMARRKAAEACSAIRTNDAARFERVIRSTWFETTPKDHPVLACAISSGKPMWLQRVISLGVDPDPHEGAKSLLIRHVCHHPKMIPILVEKGADTEQMDDNQRTALLISTTCRDVSSLRYLLGKANPHHRDRWGLDVVDLLVGSIHFGPDHLVVLKELLAKARPDPLRKRRLARSLKDSMSRYREFGDQSARQEALRLLGG